MIFSLYFLFIFFFSSDLIAKSITSVDNEYIRMCKMAVSDPEQFRTFRSIPAFSHAMELTEGDQFALYVNKNYREDQVKLSQFKRLDLIGSPVVTSYPGLGDFSATTLRYITIANQIGAIFSIPENAIICEIGGGFGGQCYILSKVLSFSKYYHYDLNEPLALMKKVTSTLGVQNVIPLKIHDEIPESTIDLLISNYAYSECDVKMQLDYFHRLFQHADRGYLIYNQTSLNCFGFESLTPGEVCALLKKHGIRPYIYPEPISTAPENLLIVWDRTRNLDKPMFDLFRNKMAHTTSNIPNMIEESEF